MGLCLGLFKVAKTAESHIGKLSYLFSRFQPSDSPSWPRGLPPGANRPAYLLRLSRGLGSAHQASAQQQQALQAIRFQETVKP